MPPAFILAPILSPASSNSAVDRQSFVKDDRPAFAGGVPQKCPSALPLSMANVALDDGGALPQARNLPSILDWNGSADPENPRNFSLTTRIATTIAATFLAFVSTLAGSIYSPSHGQIARDFAVSQEIAILPLSLYNAGLAFGPLIGAPLSETFGRKVVFLATTPIFALFIVGSGLSHSVTALCICRFFAGMFAAPAISNASATITDYTAGKYRAISLSFYYPVPFFGALLGPLIGGFVVESKGWRWTQWTVLWFIAASYLPVVFTKETYKKTILQRRARKLGLAYSSEHQKPSFLRTLSHFLTTILVRPIHMLLTEPIVTLVCMYNGFMFGLMYTYVVASPWVYQTYYNFSMTGQSLSFLGVIVGALLSPLPLITIDLYIYQPPLKRFRCLERNANLSVGASFPAENRLFGAMVGSLLLPISLLGFAWTTRSSIHFLVPMICQSTSILASLLIYVSISVFVLDTYGPLYGASAAGAAMLTRYALSAAFPMFALQMYEGLGVGWATTTLACCTALMAPIPWLFFKYGKALRDRMKYETSN